ncbi:MAG TPA: hypothetical protein VK137_06890, partial [Planctomycetaceae bacterium]|nr:hypothetical protein [Planctomycetaceae bacterium]
MRVTGSLVPRRMQPLLGRRYCRQISGTILRIVNCWPSVGAERRIPVSIAGFAGSSVIPQTTDGLSARR